jgi:hypothetical protein
MLRRFIMSHNVSAVGEVLPARIRACAARPGLAKCGKIIGKFGNGKKDMTGRIPV